MVILLFIRNYRGRMVLRRKTSSLSLYTSSSLSLSSIINNSSSYPIIQSKRSISIPSSSSYRGRSGYISNICYILPIRWYHTYWCPYRIISFLLILLSISSTTTATRSHHTLLLYTSIGYCDDYDDYTMEREEEEEEGRHLQGLGYYDHAHHVVDDDDVLKDVPIAREDLIRDHHHITNSPDDDYDDYDHFDKDYEINNMIGEGGFGVVYRCTHRRTGIERAVKIINADDIKDMRLFQNELDALLDLDSPYIVRLLEYYYCDDYDNNEIVNNNNNSLSDDNKITSGGGDRKCMKLVFSLCRGPDLLDRIRDEVGQKGRVDEEDAVVFLRHMLKAVACCHKSGIIHWDIKPENFIFTNPSKTATLKMIDMGLSRRHLTTTHIAASHNNNNNNDDDIRRPNKEEKATTTTTSIIAAGTLRYMPPEAIRQQQQEQHVDDDDDEQHTILSLSSSSYIEDPRKVDIWAIGVIFAMLLSGIPLFSLTDDEDVVIKDILNPDYVIDRISKSDEYTHISDDAYDMLCHLLAYNPDDRYDASEALNHPLITQSYQRDANNIKLNNNIHEVFDFNIINRMRHSITLPPLARICRLLIAHQCRDREIRRLRDTFRRLDIDGDGYLDKQEIISVCDYYGIQIPPDFDHIFHACDLQRNNKLNFLEFVAATLDDNLTDINNDKGRTFLEYTFQQLLDNNNNNPTILLSDNNNDHDYDDKKKKNENVIDDCKLKQFFRKSNLSDEMARLLIKSCHHRRDQHTYSDDDNNYDDVNTLNFHQFAKCFTVP